MGLKKLNYTSPKLGITLPEAYAAIGPLEIHGKHGVAHFHIQQTRDAAIHGTPLEVVLVRFDYNRKEDPRVTAYTKAKGFDTLENGEEVPMPFNGWEDDLLVTK